MSREISIRRLAAVDCQIITEAFARQGWMKPLTQYENYLKEQRDGKREVLVAELENKFAGYLTIVWRSKYPPFRENRIPEIVDFNVLIKLRNRGIGTALIKAAEDLVAQKTKIIGIGVGLTSDYGAAQRLYVRRGYVPDGQGISQAGRLLQYGDKISVDDDLTLHFTKELTKS